MAAAAVSSNVVCLHSIPSSYHSLRLIKSWHAQLICASTLYWLVLGSNIFKYPSLECRTSATIADITAESLICLLSKPTAKFVPKLLRYTCLCISKMVTIRHLGFVIPVPQFWTARDVPLNGIMIHSGATEILQFHHCGFGWKMPIRVNFRQLWGILTFKIRCHWSDRKGIQLPWDARFDLLFIR